MVLVFNQLSLKIEYFMKIKTLILLAIVAVATLSFTFASKRNEVKTDKAAIAQEPVGGFVSESSF